MNERCLLYHVLIQSCIFRPVSEQDLRNAQQAYEQTQRMLQDKIDSLSRMTRQDPQVCFILSMYHVKVSLTLFRSHLH